MSNHLKSRWWWFIAYPESLPDNWKDVLLLTGIPFIVSPLHDKDINMDGEYKKPHYHIIVIFDNPTTYNHVLTHCCKPINATIPQVILNISGCIAYLTHKGIENKAQYNENDVCCYNGSQAYLKDYDYISDVYSAIEEVIREKHPCNMLSLIDACKDITDAVSLIRSKPFYFAQLLK